MLDCRARTRPVLQYPPGVRVAAGSHRYVARRSGEPQLVRLTNSNPPVQEMLDR